MDQIKQILGNIYMHVKQHYVSRNKLSPRTIYHHQRSSTTTVPYTPLSIHKFSVSKFSRNSRCSCINCCKITTQHTHRLWSTNVFFDYRRSNSVAIHQLPIRSPTDRDKLNCLTWVSDVVLLFDLVFLLVLFGLAWRVPRVKYGLSGRILVSPHVQSELGCHSTK